MAMLICAGQSPPQLGFGHDSSLGLVVLGWYVEKEDKTEEVVTDRMENVPTRKRGIRSM